MGSMRTPLYRDGLNDQFSIEMVLSSIDYEIEVFLYDVIVLELLMGVWFSIGSVSQSIDRLS